MNIVVYFNNNNKLEHDIDKTAFSDEAGKIFCFGKDNSVFEGYYSDLVEKGYILVNWNNVSFVKFVERVKEDANQKD